MFFFLNFSLDKAVAYMQAHAIHCGFIRQRENVNTLDPVFTRIAKLLTHGNSCYETTDIHVHIGVQ